MRVTSLNRPADQYSCQPYLILGDWSSIEDVNTLIDPGPDDHVVQQIEKMYTGVGKKAVDIVVLTHNHFDHAAGAKVVKEYFGAQVLAFLPGPCVDRCVRDGETLRFGDAFFEVIHVPIHSEDSICLFSKSEGVLFSGDTALRVTSAEGSYSSAYLNFLERMAKLPLKRVYSGHDPLLDSNIASMLEYSIRMVKQSLKTRGAGQTNNDS